MQATGSNFPIAQLNPSIRYASDCTEVLDEVKNVRMFLDKLIEVGLRITLTSEISRLSFLEYSFFLFRGGIFDDKEILRLA